MVKQWKKPGEADDLLRQLIKNNQIPTHWKNEKDTKEYWENHAVFKNYSHSVFTGYYKTYVQGKS